MQKLKASELAVYRHEALAAQSGACMLCTYPIPADEVVLDHDHKTGRVRGVLHRGCNSMLGIIENNRPRFLLGGPKLFRMLERVGPYIEADYSSKPLHPTHRTDDEKRLLRNKRARTKRKTTA